MRKPAASRVAPEGEAPRQHRVRIIDGSRIEGPGKTCFRLRLCYDVVGQRIADFAITPLDKGETLDRVRVGTGDIVIADRGYPQPRAMRAVRHCGADLLVRLTGNSLNLRDGSGKPIDWLDVFAKADAAGQVDMLVAVHKARGRFEPLPMRLVITPKPPDNAERARDVARHNARKDQHGVDPRTLKAAGYMISIPSLDALTCTPQTLVWLYRVRWHRDHDAGERTGRRSAGLRGLLGQRGRCINALRARRDHEERGHGQRDTQSSNQPKPRTAAKNASHVHLLQRSKSTVARLPRPKSLLYPAEAQWSYFQSLLCRAIAGREGNSFTVSRFHGKEGGGGYLFRA